MDSDESGSKEETTSHCCGKGEQPEKIRRAFIVLPTYN